MTKITLSKGLNKPSPLDTLAQLAKCSENEDKLSLSAVTTIDNKQALLKRARRKYLGTGLSLRLVDAAKSNPNSILKKSYFNTYHCAKVLQVFASGKVKSSYCKNRWCMVCNSIRTAKLINSYKPILSEWNDKYFVTLTVPNVPAPALLHGINRMAYNFNKMRKRMQKQKKKKGKLKFIGLRKLECTYNAVRNDYHPHYHLIVRGEDVAKLAIKMWLEYYPDASDKAQDYRLADNNSCIEMFKYFTKVISKSSKGDRVIYADAMDVIFNCIRGKRTFQNFGFVKPKNMGEASTDDDDGLDLFADVYTWYQEVGDWCNVSSGEFLTGYKPTPEMEKLVNKIMVRKLHE